MTGSLLLDDLRCSGGIDRELGDLAIRQGAI
jgi:hypothetical protein